jgi:hypothetical protein
MNCLFSVNFKKYPSFEALAKYCENNSTLFASYLSSILQVSDKTGKLSYATSFQEFWKTLHENDGVLLTLDKTDGELLKEATLAYYKTIKPDARDFNRTKSEIDKIAAFGYTNVDARAEAVEALANYMIDAYYNAYIRGKNIASLKNENSFIQAAIDNFNSGIANAFGDILGYSREEKEAFFNKLGEDTGVAFLKNFVQEHSDIMTTQLENRVACYYEFMCTDFFEANGIENTSGVPVVNPRRELFEDVAMLPNVMSLHLVDFNNSYFTGKESVTEITDSEKQQSEYEQEEDLDDNPNEEAAEQNTESDYDNTFANFDNKMGLLPDFMNHVSLPIRAILGSLRQMVSVEDSIGNVKPAPDINNYLGIPKCMDAVKCASILYHRGDFESPARMMASIKKMSEQLPGLAGFSKLYSMLSSNLNLQYEFYRTFRKIVISQSRVTKQSGNTNLTSVSNSNTVQGQLFNQLMSSFKSTALRFNTDEAFGIFDDMMEKMTFSKDCYTKNSITGDVEWNRKAYIQASVHITKALQSFFPSINETSVRYYLLYHVANGETVPNYQTNFDNLINLIKQIIQSASISQATYEAQQATISQYARQNAAVRRKAMEEHRLVKAKDIVDLTQFYQPYMDKAANSILAKLATELAPYTTVHKALNETDVYNHQRSSVINDSMVTAVQEMLQSGLNTYTTNNTGKKIWSPQSPIIQFANHRSQSQQYDFSSILLEHKDEHGHIINYGLFTQDDNGNWIPTDNATELIKISLFQGAINSDNGNAVSRAKMSYSDYLASSYKSFFTDEKVGDIDCGFYLMRCPSDAPNTFIVRAPKYSTQGFLQIANLPELTAQIESIYQKASKKVYTVNDYLLVPMNRKPINIYDGSKTGNSTETFIKCLQSAVEDDKTVDFIPISKKRIEKYKLKDSEGKQIKLAFRYTMADEEGNDLYEQSDNIFVMEGEYSNGGLHNAKFLGFVEGDLFDKQSKQTTTFKTDNTILSLVTEEWIYMARHRSPAEGGIKYKIDTTHNMYTQLYNAFLQELVDMATAGDVMFESIQDQDGYYCFSYNPETYEPILKNGWTNTEHNGLHPTYHFVENDDPSKRLIYTSDKGNRKITLHGKVFSSNRFISYNPVTGKTENYGQAILDSCFSRFFTGQKGQYLRFKKTADGKMTVDVTPEQKAIIAEQLQQFVISLVTDSRDSLNNVRTLLGYTKDQYVDFDDAANYTLNHWMTYLGFDDLFEGNSKFYKNSQTFLKRAKEAQAGGTSMGMTDFTRPIAASHQQIASPLDNVTFANGKTVKMYDGFSAVTIYNTVKTDNLTLDCLVKYLTDKEKMKGAVLTEDQAKDLIYGPKDEKGNRTGGYQNTTINDGQSYITFDEWIRRITGRGQLQQYKSLIDKILDESQTLTAEDLTAFVQVQKNFYYDLYYNPLTRVISPRQIKNAEFVLVPRLIRGTELEKIAQMMEKLGIDQLNTTETSKAGQGSRFTIWDETGNLTPEMKHDLTELDNPNAEYQSPLMLAANDAQTKEYFNYNYLYTQQETKQHMDKDNKLGIQIAKKIIDNIDENAPQDLQDLKKEYFRLFSKNIQASYEGLLKKLNVLLENGKIELVDGNIVGMDYQQLFDMVFEEWSRLGADSNTKAFCTIEEGNRPQMPLCFTYNGTKAESVLQSIFNHAITRQTLPGFHAAQISGVGFKSFAEQGVVAKKASEIRSANPLNYHIEEDASGNYKFKIYADIMLPASAFGINRNSSRYKGLSKEEQDKKILADLKEQGLDTIIGYRIPTEGKQSICYMRVTQLLDDAYGSTIVVPDAWVSQTGADFDIDSVYSIQYNTYKTSDGLIKKIEYRENFDIYAWMSYVANRTKIRHEGITQELFEGFKQEAKNQAKIAQNEANSKIQELEDVVWKNLNESSQNAIRLLHQRLNDQFGANPSRDKYKIQLETEIALLNNRLEQFNKDYTTAEKQAIIDYRDVRQEILDSINGVPGTRIDFNYNDIKSSNLKSMLDKYRISRIEAYAADAKAAGLMTLEEFLVKKNGTDKTTKEEQLDIIDSANSVAARQNRMIDDMVKMLTHPYTLVENLSRSNFDEITESLKEFNTANEELDERRKGRSPYNPFSQALYHEDAMSGRNIKGMSVFRDTLCSVMNTVHGVTKAMSGIKVAYAKDKYNEASLRARFNRVEDGGEYWIVTHNMFGWSKDNNNVDGKLITTYSSQTTAHTLDAMKVGQVPNVNEFTFGVYKTLVDLGSNYRTAVSFIMQPGISRLVNAYNQSNSVFAETVKRDVVQQTLLEIADELGVDCNQYAQTDTIVRDIAAHYVDAIMALGLFNMDNGISTTDESLFDTPLNADLHKDRIANTGIFEGDDSKQIIIKNQKRQKKADKVGSAKLTVGEAKLLYDVFTILQFNKINHLATDAQAAARLLCPDKFGAKQTIYTTRKVFDNIVDVINTGRHIDGTTDFRLVYDDNGVSKNILEAVYPHLDITENSTTDDLLERISNDDNFIKESRYPFLAAYLKYATVPSIIINQTLFDTQRPEFRNLIFDPAFGLKQALSNGRHLTEATVNDFTKYAVNHLILEYSRFLQAPLGYTKGQGFTYMNQVPSHDATDMSEARRVRGEGYPSAIGIFDENHNVVPFTVENINDPTQDEINAFAALTPAQKVIWVSQNFQNCELCKYISADTYVPAYVKFGKARHMLTLQTQEGSSESIYKAFSDAFTSTHPFVALMAADVVKFAFYVEGYSIGTRNVTKAIKNSVLTADDMVSGTGIVSDFKNTMASLDTYLTNDSKDVDPEFGKTANEMIVENYIRSHYKTAGIAYHKVWYTNKLGYELNPDANNGIIMFNMDESEDKTLAAKYNIIYNLQEGGTYDVNRYVRLGFGKTERLYRICQHEGALKESICLIPLIPLAPTENGVYSFLQSNNEGIAQPKYYETLLRNYYTAASYAAGVQEINRIFDEQHFDQNEDLRKENYLAPTSKYNDEMLPRPMTEEENINNAPGFATLKKTINDWLNTKVKDRTPVLYVLSKPLGKYIKGFGPAYSDTYVIENMTNASTKRLAKVTITKLDVDNTIKQFTGNKFDKPLYNRHNKPKFLPTEMQLIQLVRQAAESINSETKTISTSTNPAFKFGDVYAVQIANELKPKTESDEMYSTILDEAAVEMSVSMGIRSRNGEDEAAFQLNQYFEQLGITNKTSKIGPYTETVVSQTAKYLTDTAAEYLNTLQNYIQDPTTGEYYAINDKRAIELVCKSPMLTRQFFADLLKQQQLLGQFDLITHVDPNSEDAEMQIHIENAQKALRDIQNTTLVDSAFKNMAEFYYDGSTNHPMIKSGLTTVLAGFNQTNWLNAMFNGIEETSNPIIQIAMKNFQTQFSAKERMAERDAEAFLEHMEDIERRAFAAGKRIDMNNIVDEYGRFKNMQSEQFLKDRRRLKNEHNNAIKKYGRGSIQELRARLAYDEWKAENLEQPALQGYYLARNRNLRKMLYGYDRTAYDTVRLPDGSFGKSNDGHIIHEPAQEKVLIAYETLLDQLMSLQNKRVKGFYDKTLEEKITETSNKMNSLLQGYDDTVYPAIDESKIGNIPEPMLDAAYAQKQKMLDAINNYVNRKKELNKMYFYQEVLPGFEQKLEKNRKIVMDCELKGKTDTQQYINAKRWLNENVNEFPIWTAEEQKEIDDAIKNTIHSSSFKKRDEIKKNPKYRNESGEFDPRLVSAKDLKELKEEEINAYSEANPSNIGETLDYASDFALITNKEETNEIYTKEFYDAIGAVPKDVKIQSKKWRETIIAINEILTPLYDVNRGIVDFNRLPMNDEGAEILHNLADLYTVLENLRVGKKKTKRRVQTIINFFDTYIDTKSYKPQYDNDKALYNIAKTNGETNFAYYLLDVIKRIPHDGGEAKPNRYLYGRLRLKNTVSEADRARFVSQKATKRQNVLNKYFEYVPKAAFYEKSREMQLQGKEAYRNWLSENTVYNPYTRTVQPLSVWLTRRAKTDNFEYFPKYNQTSRKVREGHFSKYELDNNSNLVAQMIEVQIPDKARAREVYDQLYGNVKKGIVANPKLYIPELDFRNKHYADGAGYAGNYHKHEGSVYGTENNMNEFEQETLNYMQEVLSRCTKTAQGRAYLHNGWLPARKKGAEMNLQGLGREGLKLMGINEETYDPSNWYDTVDYAKDRPPVMPMLAHLKGKNEESFGAYPVQQEGQSDEDFQEEVRKWKENKHRIEMETHKRLLDTDWLNVIHDYIIEAGRYNATQDGKYELFFARTLLQKYGHYISTYNKRGKKVYKRNLSNTDAEDTDYLRTPDTELIQQFDVIIRRLVYNQYKARNNKNLIKCMSVLQSITSAQYMMMNIKGGFANVNLGESSIMTEAFASEYFDKKAWYTGKAFYGTGILDYFRTAYGGEATTLAGQIIDFMDVIDYDSTREVTEASKSAYEGFRKFRNFQYCPQTAGEHEMQNSAMFSLMESHRFVEDTSRSNYGMPKYRLMSFAEFVRDEREKVLLSVLTPAQVAEYKQFKEKVTTDENTARDYMHFRKDFTTVYIMRGTGVTEAQQREFVRKLKDTETKAKAEFNNDTKHPTLLSQFEAGTNGRFKFKDGSIMSNLDVVQNSDGVTEAYTLLGEFRGRVISVNQYIHGIYDKVGRAQVEKTWIGSLLMQYHKHLPIGIMKWYRVEGMYNEERGTVMKGINTSLWDFLSLNFKKDKELLNLTDENVTALEHVQSVFKGVIELSTKVNLYYNLLPEYDKANIRRAICTTLIMLSTIAATIALRAGWDDEDSLLYNLALYETDRLATEASQYFPITAWGEARKLYKSPVAAGSGITDLLSSANMIAHMIIDGEDFDGTYKSGKFAGENKLKVYIQRRIPIYRGLKSSLVDIKDNNQFYKVSENVLGFVNAAAIAEELKK